MRRLGAAEAAPTRSNRRSAPEPARDAVAVVARPGADQRDLVHLRYAEQAQRVPVRDEGFDVVAPFKELQLPAPVRLPRSEEHTSELQSLMRISYAVFCLKKKTIYINHILLPYIKRRPYKT